jgi:hypothetical protein
VHRPPYCCVLPVVTLRVLTAADLLPAHIQRGPASRNLSSSCTSCCSQQSNRRTRSVRFGYAAATATAPASNALSRAGVLRLYDGTTSAKCSVISLRSFFSGCAARSSFVQRSACRVGLAGLPSQSAFTRSRCVGPHATYPASCAVRMRPSSLSAAKRTTDKCPCPLPSRLNSDNRAKPPANPMDIACPVSSMWVTLHLIRFRKRPLHFSAVTEGFALGKAVPSMVLFRRVDARARGW